MIARATTGALALLLVCSAAYPADPAPLRSNPFQRPASATVVPVVPVVGIADAPLSVGNTIELRATMVGAHSTLADVGGRIMRPGDVIDEFELVAVWEDRATFRYGNKMITVRVKPALDGSNE